MDTKMIAVEDVVALNKLMAKHGGARGISELAHAIDGTNEMLANPATAAVVADPGKAVVRLRRARTAKQKAPKGDGRQRASATEVEARKAAALRVFTDAPRESVFSKADVEAKLGESVDSRTLGILVKDGKLIMTGERRAARYRLA